MMKLIKQLSGEDCRGSTRLNITSLIDRVWRGQVWLWIQYMSWWHCW